MPLNGERLSENIVKQNREMEGEEGEEEREGERNGVWKEIEKEETKKEKEMEKGKEEKDEFEANRTSWTSWLYETIHFLLCLPSDILTNTN